MKQVQIRVIAEEGWSYNGNKHPLGTRFEIPEEQIKDIQHYFDDQTIEKSLPLKSVDTKEKAELIAETTALTFKLCQEKFKIDVNESIKHMRIHDRYQDAPEYTDTGGWTGIAEMAKDIYSQAKGYEKSETLSKWLSSEKVATSMGETIQSDGGVLVPVQFRNQLLMPALEESIIAPRATPVTMDQNQIEIPAIVVTSNATTLFGGINASWGEEAKTQTSTKPKLGLVTLKLNNLNSFVIVTDDLMEDSAISLENTLPVMFGQAMSFEMDEAFITGTGAGQPKGLLNAESVVSIAKENDQEARTIVFENIVNMFARCRNKKNMVWICNHDVIPQLLAITIVVGTGGAPAGLLREQTIQGEIVQTMLGKPVLYTEKCKTLGTKGDIIAADLTQYLIGTKRIGTGTGGMQSSIHLKFDSHQTAFRMKMRMDGQSWWKGAITPRQGSNSMSPVVTLDTRA
ncbi:MAG: phage major capsid protein [Planctomycetes bacterium]|nr:phage major capsid protein [Planctomycetota bacterium]